MYFNLLVTSKFTEFEFQLEFTELNGPFKISENQMFSDVFWGCGKINDMK